MVDRRVRAVPGVEQVARGVVATQQVELAVRRGGVGGYFFSRVIARNLFQTTPTDATAYAAVAGLFLLAGAVAAFVPAKRITSINPLTVLGSD